MWFNSVEIAKTKEKLLALRLTPSGDYKNNLLSVKAFLSSPTHSLGSKYFTNSFLGDVSQISYFNCSDRLPVCRQADYYQVTFQFSINLSEMIVENDNDTLAVKYSNVSINDPCVKEKTGSTQDCSGNGICVPYLWEFSSSCLCRTGFTGVSCEKRQFQTTTTKTA